MYGKATLPAQHIINNKMKYLNSIKTNIIDRGICIGIPAIKFLYSPEFFGNSEICLNSGVKEFFTDLDENKICNLLENYVNEFFYFENPLIDWINAKKIISKLKNKNNYIFISNYATDQFINYSDEVCMLVDLCDIRTSLDLNSESLFSLAKTFKNTELSISFDVYIDTPVFDFNNVAEKLSEINDSIKIVLNPKKKLFSKNLLNNFGYVFDKSMEIKSADNDDCVWCKPDEEQLFALCYCGNCYLETKVIKEMEL